MKCLLLSRGRFDLGGFRALIFIAFLITCTKGYGQVSADTVRSETDFSKKRRFGRGDETVNQLEENRTIKLSHFRFPKLDTLLRPYFDWKEEFDEKTGLSIGAEYNVLVQSVTNAPDERFAAGGVFRIYGSWKIWGEDEGNLGRLVAKVESRHSYGGLPGPGEYGWSGYRGVTGALFSNDGFFLNALYYSQRFNNMRSGILVGRVDPNEYQDVSTYANPYTGFGNSNTLSIPTQAYFRPGIGTIFGHWFNEQIYFQGMLVDANGSFEGFDVFKGGAEFFKYLEVGWSPSFDRRYNTNYHVIFYHVDDRSISGTEGNWGLSASFNQALSDRAMVYGRVGYATGWDNYENATPQAKSSFIAGISFYALEKTDVIGIAAGWYEPTDPNLRVVQTTEIFYRFQFAQNTILVPSIQLHTNPGLTEEDFQVLFGFKGRFTI